MIFYQGQMPNFHFKLDGYTYLGELCESQFEDCQLILTQQGLYEYPVERANQIKGTFRYLVNTKTKEIRALTIAIQMRLTAENNSNYEHNARFIIPIEVLKADDVKKALRSHVLACLMSFQGQIVQSMSQINGVWLRHNKELYDQFINDNTIDAINPKFFPKSDNGIYDIFNHTNIRLTEIGKGILKFVTSFSEKYELSCTGQLNELLNEFRLPLLTPNADNKLLK